MSGYSGVKSHRSMFFDDLRNDFYSRAIAKIISPDSVVLDLGAGLGLHGAMALNHGAKKIYLVEPSPIIEVTRQVVEENDLTGKVECIRGKIEEVELPEKVDCIISVFTGNFLLSEDLLPSLFYARDHYLRPGGTLIPDKAKMVVVPVCAEEYYEKHIDCWSNTSKALNYGLVRKSAVNTLYHDGPEDRKEEFLAKPVTLLQMDFMTATEAACRNQVEVTVNQDGLCHGWVGWFQTRLGGEWLSTSPQTEQMHWRQVFLPLNQPIPVNKGETMAFELHRAEYSKWTWTISFSGKRMRQSTFYSETPTLEEFEKITNGYIGRLSQNGRAALYVLEHLNGTFSTAEIVSQLSVKYPELFGTSINAENYVKRLIKRHC